MANDIQKLPLTASAGPRFPPILRKAAAAAFMRVTDQSIPWTSDNAPPGLLRALDWLWTWGLMAIIGLGGGAAFGFYFL